LIRNRVIDKDDLLWNLRLHESLELSQMVLQQATNMSHYIGPLQCPITLGH